MRCPAQSKRKDSDAGYESLSHALSQFENGNNLPIFANLQDTLMVNQAKFIKLVWTNLLDCRLGIHSWSLQLCPLASSSCSWHDKPARQTPSSLQAVCRWFLYCSQNTKSVFLNWIWRQPWAAEQGTEDAGGTLNLGDECVFTEC